MRELIDVTFRDLTSYSPQVGGDVGGIVIDAPWGPCGKLKSCSFEEFQALFPFSKHTKIPKSQLTAFRAFLSGLSTIEVVRLQGDNVYQGFEVVESYGVDPGSEIVPVTKATLEGVENFIGLKYPGVPPEGLNPNYTDFRITVEAETDALTGVVIVKISLVYTDLESDTNVILETVEGGCVLG